VDCNSRYQQGVIVHTLFDLLAVLSAMAVTMACYRWRLHDAAQRVELLGVGYAVALVGGAALGGFGAGTLNLWLSGIPGVGRSIVGALAGAIAAVEIFKWQGGIRQSTGLIFVPAFATSVAVGRIGCYLAGLADNTYGTPTTLPWGHDFGDGVLRHPVQLYESFSMLGFLAVALVLLARREPFFMRNGFYLLVLYYGAQRFLWEFLKPYGDVAGPFNIFHFICLALCCYSIGMMVGRRDGRANS
jgi:phosphatidylglycerol---prolipoprotein diacylglyceryl transferase